MRLEINHSVSINILRQFEKTGSRKEEVTTKFFAFINWYKCKKKLNIKSKTTITLAQLFSGIEKLIDE